MRRRFSAGYDVLQRLTLEKDSCLFKDRTHIHSKLELRLAPISPKLSEPGKNQDPRKKSSGPPLSGIRNEFYTGLFRFRDSYLPIGIDTPVTITTTDYFSDPDTRYKHIFVPRYKTHN